MIYLDLLVTSRGECSRRCPLNDRDNACRAGWHRIQGDRAASVPGPECPMCGARGRGRFRVINTERS